MPDNDGNNFKTQMEIVVHTLAYNKIGTNILVVFVQFLAVFLASPGVAGADGFYCPVDGKTFTGGEKFCPDHGKQLVLSALVCPKDGKKFTGGEKFCSEHGLKLVAAQGKAKTSNKPADKYVDWATGMEFVGVSGGCFEMSNDNTMLDFNKKGGSSTHEVCVDSFMVGKYEVTQEQWLKLMEKNPSEFKKGGNYPVENVSWNDVQKYITKLNQKTGKNYRLPTEAEWEYACRSGGKNESYCGYKLGDPVNGFKPWTHETSNEQSSPVGKTTPNGLGIHDMSGNVWEWCSDWYLEDYYKNSPRNNPQGPSIGKSKIIRGGSWSSPLIYSSASISAADPPEEKGNMLGFRLVSP